MNDLTKVCPKCGIMKPLSEYYGTGRGSCKECRRAQARAHYWADPERARERHRVYSEKNREYLREKARQYYRDNRESQAAVRAEWQRNNRDKMSAAQKRWYEKNRESRLASIKEWRLANPERVAEMNRNWQSRRRSYMANVQVIEFTDQQLAQRVSYFGGTCWICRTATGTEMDHVKPVSKGGPHMLANLRPACRSCNASKNAAWPFRTGGLIDA